MECAFPLTYRKDDVGNYRVFTQAWDTGALFNSTFAEIFGYPDPTAPGQFLSLCSLFQRGMVHEVWMTGWPAELHSYAPRYDSIANLVLVTDQS